jgi:hypothetical protein
LSTLPSTSWAPNEHACISQSQPIAFFFASAVHQPLQKVWDEAKYLHLTWLIITAENNAFIWHFSRFLTFRSEANVVPNKKAIDGLE